MECIFCISQSDFAKIFPTGNTISFKSVLARHSLFSDPEEKSIFPPVSSPLKKTFLQMGWDCSFLV